MLSNWAVSFFRVYFFFLYDSRIARTHYTRKLHTLHFFALCPVLYPYARWLNRRRNGTASCALAWRCAALAVSQPLIMYAL